MAGTLTRAGFRRWSENQPRRYEHLAGVPIAMAPERVVHARIRSRLWTARYRAIPDAALDCEALPDGITVEIDRDTDSEPDAVVNCGARLPPDAVAATNPIIVVAVLSLATQAIEVDDKLAEYFRVPPAPHYLVVRARRDEVIRHRRGVSGEIAARIVTSGVVMLDPPGIGIALDETYPDFA